MSYIKKIENNINLLKVFQAMEDPTGFNRRDMSTIGDFTFDDATKTLTIEPRVGESSFSHWIKGTEYINTTADTFEITDVEGTHFIYYNKGTIEEVVNPSTTEVSTVIHEMALISILYWDVSEQEAIYVGEERHGINMDSSTHSYLHFLDGLRWQSGLGLNTMDVDGSGNDNTAAQFGIDIGGVYDEDIFQALSAVLNTAGCPIYYLTGASDWNKYLNTGYSVRTFDGTDATRLAFNEYTGGAWQLTEVTERDFVLCHIFATTEKDIPMIAFMGQAQYTNLRKARAGAEVEILSLITDNTLSPEIRAIATIIFETQNAYSNDVKSRVRSTDDGDNYIDWRNETISRTAVSTSDHNNLSGLQGGIVGEYYHLTATEIATLHDAVTVTDTATIDLTLTGQDISADVISSAINHNDLNNIQGGNATERYHLTALKHSYIDQDVTSGSSPVFDVLNLSGTLAAFILTPSTAPTTHYQVANKKYVDKEITDVTITASNGLTKSSNNITLGGALTTTTVISKANNTLGMIGEGSIQFQGEGSTYRSEMDVKGNSGTDGVASLGVYKKSTFERIFLEFALGVGTITDEINSKGLVNAADYSAASSARSLIDKAHIESLIPDVFWDRTGTILSPVTAGDDLEMGTGDVTATRLESTLRVRTPQIKASLSAGVAIKDSAHTTVATFGGTGNEAVIAGTMDVSGAVNRGGFLFLTKSSSTTITTGAFLTWSTHSYIDTSFYTHSIKINSEVIEFDVDGLYKMTADLTVDFTGVSTQRTVAKFDLHYAANLDNPVPSWVILANSASFVYSRMPTDGEGTTSMIYLINAVAGSGIKIQGIRYGTAGATLVALGGACRLMIEKVG